MYDERRAGPRSGPRLPPCLSRCCSPPHQARTRAGDGSSTPGTPVLDNGAATRGWWPADPAPVTRVIQGLVTTCELVDLQRRLYTAIIRAKTACGSGGRDQSPRPSRRKLPGRRPVQAAGGLAGGNSAGGNPRVGEMRPVAPSLNILKRSLNLPQPLLIHDQLHHALRPIQLQV